MRVVPRNQRTWYLNTDLYSRAPGDGFAITYCLLDSARRSAVSARRRRKRGCGDSWRHFRWRRWFPDANRLSWTTTTTTTTKLLDSGRRRQISEWSARRDSGQRRGRLAVGNPTADQVSFAARELNLTEIELQFANCRGPTENWPAEFRRSQSVREVQSWRWRGARPMNASLTGSTCSGQFVRRERAFTLKSLSLIRRFQPARAALVTGRCICAGCSAFPHTRILLLHGVPLHPPHGYWTPTNTRLGLPLTSM